MWPTLIAWFGIFLTHQNWALVPMRFLRQRNEDPGIRQFSDFSPWFGGTCLFKGTNRDSTDARSSHCMRGSSQQSKNHHKGQTDKRLGSSRNYLVRVWKNSDFFGRKDTRVLFTPDEKRQQALNQNWKLKIQKQIPVFSFLLPMELELSRHLLYIYFAESSVKAAKTVAVVTGVHADFPKTVLLAWFAPDRPLLLDQLPGQAPVK